MFRIKICGVTTPQDAAAVRNAGADAIGLNFYQPSPRYVSQKQAQEIVTKLRGSTTLIGVFVNSTPEVVARTAGDLGLAAVQLHGDEPPEMLADLPPELPIIRALRFGTDGVDGLVNYLDRAAAGGRMPDALLVDAAADGAYGGTGERFDWGQLAQKRSLLGSLPLILAGGLRPENVAEAIRTVRPEGVDTASGVESSPGKKDPAAITRFVAEALRFF